MDQRWTLAYSAVQRIFVNGQQATKEGTDVELTVVEQEVVDAILALIPSAATALNKLTDKAYVDSSIATAAATFRGTSPEGLTQAQFLAWANALEHDKNDTVFWKTTDTAGNTLYKKYKYNGSEWKFEYDLNNSSFTAAQWAAINSGITAATLGTISDRANEGHTAYGYFTNGKLPYASISGAPTELPNPEALSWSGYSSGSYDGSEAAEIEIPNNTNQLTNGAGFITASALTPYALKTYVDTKVSPLQEFVDMFEYDATTRTLILKKDGDNERHFAAYGDISAGGIGQGGSGGDGILAMYIKTPSGRVRIDDIDTRAAEFGIKVNGTLATPVDGVISINTASGSVTSVALSVPTGFSVTGSPITSSGTLAIGFASGYSLPTTAKQTLWDTAYGWGNHASAGYLKAADLTDIENGLKSLQSQIDSVSARDSFDELTVSSMFADVLAASVIYGTLHGNADTATDASMLGGHASSYFATASALSTHTGNTSNPHSVTFAQLLSKPTTISGYGITDAYTKTQVDAKDITAVSLTASKLTLTRTNGNLEATVPTWNQDTTGNAATATKLKTARSIWGQNFDGTTAISGNMSGVGTINFTGKATDEIGLEIVTVGGVRYLHTTLPFYSDSNISAGGVGSGGSGDAIWGAIEGTLSNQTDLWNVLQGKQASLGVGTNGQILATKNGAIAWVDAPATGVTSVINLTGDITQAQLRTALGLGSAAYTESSAYAAASHTHSQYITGITSSMVIAALGYTPYNSSNPAGYLVASDLANIEKSIQSLQSQVDSVSARDGYDELYATSLFSDIIVGTNIYGALHGNADSATNADTLDGQHGSYYATASALSTHVNNTGNPHGVTKTQLGLGNVENKSSATIRSELTAANVTTALGATYVQNASYATSAGNAGTVNNHTVNTDVPAGAVFTDTHDTNVAGTGISVSGTRGSTIAISSQYQTYISHGETAYNDQTKVSQALQSLQSQIDSVAARDGFGELYASYLHSDIIAAGNVYGALRGNADTATNATNATYATYDTAGENISDKFSIVSQALQSLQSQVDSVASRDFAELAETLMSLKMWIEDMFEKTSSGIHAKYSLYSDGGITAGA